MANVTELTDSTFQSTLQNAKGPILVDFAASWCQPCKILAPTIEAVAEEYGDRLSVYKVDIEKAPETAASLGIASVPTCIFFKDQKEVDRFYGAQDLRAVKSHVEKVLG
ncbi:MAG: thioredoxin [Planctomycetota bacterium]